MMPAPIQDLLDTLASIAPLELAEAWDNTGLLVDAPQKKSVKRCLLTIDLTETVFDEALSTKSDFIVAYHPLIFGGLKRITRTDAKQRIVHEAIRKGIPIYSPHTALDSAPGGVNDWLCDGLGPSRRRSISARAHGPKRKLTAHPDSNQLERLEADLVSAGASMITGDERPGTLSAIFSSDTVLRVLGNHKVAHEVLKLEQTLDDTRGQGREVWLNKPCPLDTIIKRVKRHIGQKHVRVARAGCHAAGEAIEHIALCAGAGGSVINGQKADLYWTGEMRHHDILTALEHGTSVIVCDHTNTERGYLKVLRERLLEGMNKRIDVNIAAADKDPLQIV